MCAHARAYTILRYVSSTSKKKKEEEEEEKEEDFFGRKYSLEPVSFSTRKFVTYIIDNLRGTLTADYRDVSSGTRIVPGGQTQ